MRKIVIVINGKGGAGKDTICDIVSRHYGAVNVSSIDPIKEIAVKCGWNGEKDKKSRRFLADLKEAFSRYNNLPTKYLLEKYAGFMADPNDEIMFVHIREATEIERFRREISSPLATLYIDRKGLERHGNESDDNADRFDYDFIYNNDQTLDELECDFMPFFNSIIESI